MVCQLLPLLYYFALLSVERRNQRMDVQFLPLFCLQHQMIPSIFFVVSNSCLSNKTIWRRKKLLSLLFIYKNINCRRFKQLLHVFFPYIYIYILKLPMKFLFICCSMQHYVLSLNFGLDNFAKCVSNYNFCFLEKKKLLSVRILMIC